MKKISKNVLFFSLIILFTFSFFSCSKDNSDNLVKPREGELLLKSNNNDNLRVFKLEKSKSGRKILSFESYEDFHKVSVSLEKLVDKHNDQFLKLHPELSDEDLNNMEEAEGFEEFQPLFDFELENDFNSLWSKTYEAENKWLESQKSFLDWSTYPKNPLSDYTNILLNEDGKVIINGKEEDLIQRTEGLCFWAGNNPDDTVMTDDCCIVGIDSRSLQYNNGDREIRVTVKLIPVSLFYSTLQGKIKSYKRSGSGWRKHRASLSIQVGGTAYTFGCENSDSISKYKGVKKRRTLSVTIHHWGGNLRTRDGEFAATGNLLPGIALSAPLIFDGI